MNLCKKLLINAPLKTCNIIAVSYTHLDVYKRQAYSEIVFTDVLWPDFSEADLIKSCEEFAKRNRRFGAR